jgi:hypothetical protein
MRRHENCCRLRMAGLPMSFLASWLSRYPNRRSRATGRCYPYSYHRPGCPGLGVETPEDHDDAELYFGRLADLDTDHEPTIPGVTPSLDQVKVPAVLGSSGLGSSPTWSAPPEHRRGSRVVQPRLGKQHHATILGEGSFQLEDGRLFTTPSAAAGAAANGSFDGWHLGDEPARCAPKCPLSPVRGQAVRPGG